MDSFILSNIYCVNCVWQIPHCQVPFSLSMSFPLAWYDHLHGYWLDNRFCVDVCWHTCHMFLFVWTPPAAKLVGRDGSLAKMGPVDAFCTKDGQRLMLLNGRTFSSTCMKTWKFRRFWRRKGSDTPFITHLIKSATWDWDFGVSCRDLPFPSPVKLTKCHVVFKTI